MYGRRNKYRAKKTVVDGITFHSMKEAKRYRDLTLLQRGKEISGLELQPKFPIEINGKKVCTYIADFKYKTKQGEEIVEDCKGFKTDMYRLKKKMTEAYYGIEITET